MRILHGTGTGILRMLIRQYLETVPGVRHFADEHIQFGGAGITVVAVSYTHLEKYSLDEVQQEDFYLNPLGLDLAKT